MSPTSRLAAALALLALGCAPPAPAPAPNISLIDSLPSPSPSASADVVPSGAFLFYEDFEQGAGRWTMSAAPGPGWRLLQAYTCGGAFTMHLGLPEQAPFQPAAGTAELALAAPLDLTKGRSPRLKFDVLGTATPEGAIVVQAEARDPGAVWKPLGEPVTARHALMRSIVRDLSPWAGRRAELRFRAEMSPGTAPTQGFYLDDVQVIEPS